MEFSIWYMKFIWLVIRNMHFFSPLQWALELSSYNKYIWGPTEIWTRIAGFKVQSANHYTMGPAYWIITCCFLNTTHHAFDFANQLFSHISRLTASINHKRESVKNIQTGWSSQNIVLFFHRQWNIWIQLTLFWMSCTCT